MEIRYTDKIVQCLTADVQQRPAVNGDKEVLDKPVLRSSSHSKNRVADDT